MRAAFNQRQLRPRCGHGQISGQRLLAYEAAVPQTAPFAL